NALQNGNDSVGLPGANSGVDSDVVEDLNAKVEVIKVASNSIIGERENIPPLPVASFEDDIEKIKHAESGFLATMDDIVNQYDYESDQKVKWLRKLELFIMGITLALLLAEFLFIFWPTAKTVKKSLAELIQAEKTAKRMAYEADLLSIEKEKSIKEL